MGCRRFLWWLIVSLGWWMSFCPADTYAAEPTRLDYGRDIRPILSENCFYCHGQDANHRKADLRLDTLEGQRSEGIVVPGKPDESELIQRIFSSEPSQVMPPPKSNRRLTEEQKQLLRRWIAEGAVFETHWAFRAPKRPPIPQLPADQLQPKHPIDAFIRAKLPSKGLKPAPQADRVTLLRRLYFDLIGLPPTPEEVDAFVHDPSPDAYEKWVERLLNNPHFGERMALPWLDAARYADSNGFQQDGDTFQWVWRDWVVRALNNNMPFDRFTIEQLAGDLLPNATVEQKIATGFNRNHLVNGEGGAIPEEQRFNILFDRVDVTATNWLGLTMACAQCHDHKYDPITMRDYYGLLAAFNQVSESGVAGRQTASKRVSPPFIEVPSPEHLAQIARLEKRIADKRAQFLRERQAWEATVAANEQFPDPEIRALVRSTDAKTKAERDAKLQKYFEEKVQPKLLQELKAAEKELNNYRGDEVPKVMIMADDRPRETHILDRGEYLKKKEPVTFSTPAFLPPLPRDAPKNRLGLALWLVSAENPLTARVAVNRLWQTFFGAGLVKTSEDFGVQSEVPIHQDLLDWLAVDFRESGWDIKGLIRKIVTSETYKQSSKTSAELLQKDPENRYYARGPRFRLPAMLLRDLALSASGLLDRRIGGKPVYPYQPEGIWETLAITKERDFTYPTSKGKDLYRRSLYTFWRRTVGPANMFDASSRQTCKVRPSLTNTPLHALTMLNDPTWVEAARVLAANAMTATSEMEGRLAYAFRRILARPPRPQEVSVLKRMLEQQTALFRADPEAAKKLTSVGESPRATQLDSGEHAAWTSICLALFNLDEAMTRE